MKTRPFNSLLVLSAITLQFFATAFAQGPLAPPAGPPVASMKTLDQVEARTPIESLPYIINAPGSYYFTKNLQFTATSGDALRITSPNVTLDLNGFTLSSTAGVTGKGIFVTGGLNNIVIKNGNIAGNSTVFPTAIGGFENGINADASSGIPFGAFRNLTVEAMQVSGCRNYGILVYYGTVTHCTVGANGSDGLIASESIVTGCIAKFNGGSGIYGATITNSSAISNGRNGIVASSGSVTGCVARDNNTSAGAYYDLNATDAVIGSTKYGTGNVTGSSIDGERRTAIESLPYIISAPGSYFLAKNLQFTAASGDAIRITSPNVTFDLGGFTLSSTAAVTGKGIFVTGGLNNIVIKNGNIAGNSTTVYPTAIGGFENGINADASSGIPFGAFRNLTVEAMQVSGCRNYGILVYYGTVTHCTVGANGSDGLIASDSIVTGCIAKFNGGSGIRGSTITNSSAISNGRDGIVASSGSVTGCVARNNNTSAGAYYDLNANDAVVAFTKYGTGNTTGSTLTGNKTP